MERLPRCEQDDLTEDESLEIASTRITVTISLPNIAEERGVIEETVDIDVPLGIDVKNVDRYVRRWINERYPDMNEKGYDVLVQFPSDPDNMIIDEDWSVDQEVRAEICPHESLKQGVKDDILEQKTDTAEPLFVDTEPTSVLDVSVEIDHQRDASPLLKHADAPSNAYEEEKNDERGSISHVDLEKSYKKQELIFIGCWFLLNLYNIGNGIFNTHDLSLKYFFQLTHITSFAILTIAIIGLCKKHQNQETGSFFSNGVSFVLGLSVVTDAMFWLYVNKGLHFNTLSHGLDSADALIMHGLITVILLGWMIHQKQIPFLKNYKPFKGSTACKAAKTAAGIAIPIALIAGIYMGITYLGQKFLLHNQAIYRNVLDWNHPTLTYRTFAKAAIGFLVLMVTYWAVAGLVHGCHRLNSHTPLLNTPVKSDETIDQAPGCA